ncbi:MAG: bifunctional 4-hydroxy-2-oxoglutarate aldolase/2-dehydro-3-deoxy-phosphogluconate aldolase [Cyanobacteria bacterium J06597_16]
MGNSLEPALVQAIRERWLQQLKKHRAIAIIRAPSVKIGLSMAKAAAKGGFCLIEVAWHNNAQPAAMVATLRQALPQCVVGVGTVLTEADLQDAVSAGAAFCFTPHTNCQLIEQAIALNCPIIAGAMTPTEIVTAWQAGAASVKVFPISALGNAQYVRSLLGPLGPIPLVPTGGVTSESAPQLIEAGAIAVGLSTALFPPTEIETQDWAAIETRSRYLITLLTGHPNNVPNATGLPG